MKTISNFIDTSSNMSGNSSSKAPSNSMSVLSHYSTEIAQRSRPLSEGERLVYAVQIAQELNGYSK